METYKSICIGCGKDIEFECYEVGDFPSWHDGMLAEDDDVIGWSDHECTCGWLTDYRDIELIVEGDLEGYCCCLETADEVRNFAKLLYKEHPELFGDSESVQTEKEK